MKVGMQMNKLYGVLLTLISGLFFLIGGLLSLKVKDKDKLNHFSTGLALVIIFNLLIFDLAPEVLEMLEDKSLSLKIIFTIIFVGLGILILKLLDHFIPDHHHEHHDIKDNMSEHKGHMKHIGVLTIVSLVLHNLLEGFAIFGMALNDFKIGLFTCLSVALHNIPLGTHIFSSMDVKRNKNLILFLTLSSLLGGLIFLVIGSVSNIVLSAISLITMGMLLYIAFLELLPEVTIHIKSKATIMGIITGFILALITVLV